MRTVIFDFGNVVVDWDPWLLYQTVFASRAEFEDFLRDSQFFACLDRTDGGETFATILAETATRAAHCVDPLRAYVERFAESIAGVNPGVAAVIADLRALGVPLYGLTNWSAEFFPATRARHDVFAQFTDIIVSGVEKLIKPDPRIYRLAISRWGLDPARTLFVDDRVENVRAAEAEGIRGHVFRDAPTLRRELRTYFPKLGEVGCTPN